MFNRAKLPWRIVATAAVKIKGLVTVVLALTVSR